MQAFIAGYCEISLIKSVSERRNYFEPGTDEYYNRKANTSSANTTRPAARHGERAPRPDTPPDSAGYDYVSDYPWSDATAGQLERIRDTDTRQAFKARAADELNRRRQKVDGMAAAR